MAPPKVGMSFAVVRKKTPFQKAKEEEELKRKRDAADAARLLGDFEESFADAKKSKGMTFVSAGVQGAGSRPGDEVATEGRGKVYAPAFPASEMDEAEAEDGAGEVRSTEAGDGATPAPGTSSKGSKPRAIDALMGEMMAKQRERELARLEGREVDPPLGGRRGSRGDDEKSSTNLFVGNLPRDIEEHALMMEFAKYGPIASVKIMWPREDEDISRRTQLTGFVAFMTRTSAEQALEEMDGKVLGRHDLKVNWSKAVPLPAKPIWPPDGDDDESRDDDDRRAGHARAGTSGVSGVAPPAPPPPSGAAEVVVHFPEDQRIVALVDTLARYVAEDGRVFERAVMDRERDNEDFAFLFDQTCATHTYYRWRVFSLAQGDTLTKWRRDPFVMVAGGLRWTPPDPSLQPNTLDEPAIALTGVDVNETRLTESDAETFATVLRSLTLERSDIENGMVFAIDHAEAADDVAEMLTEALTLAETPVVTKVARLFLASDILHNCGAPVKHASAYRRAFQTRLPRVFQSLRETLRGVGSRITREALKKRVAAVLSAWSSWFLFQEEYLRGLEFTFAMGGMTTPHSLPTEEAQALAAEFRAMGEEDLERACRAKGLLSEGGAEACATRLIELETHARCEKR